MTADRAASPAREHLRQSEERLRLLVEGVRDYAIFMLDPGGHVLSWNTGAERIKGYRADDIIGRHFSVFYPQEAIDRGWPEHELTVASREGRFEDEGWRLRKDGTPFWANVVITALRGSDGVLQGFAKVTRDLSERRRHEEELRQSEEQNRLLVESVQDYAIFMLDPEGVIRSWNAGAMRIKGYAADEIIGRHFSVFYPDDAVTRGWPDHELAVAQREGRFEDEGWRIRKNGSRFWANVVITAVHGPQGELRGFAKVTRDLTQRRRIEELQEEGHRLKQFLAMLGHELRNPLTPIRNAAALLDTSAGDPGVTAKVREIIERQVSHLARMLDDLLDVARVSTGKIVVKRELLDLGPLAARVFEAVRPAMEAKGQETRMVLPEQPILVHADATRISQVIVNLLTNASKYTQEGGHIRLELASDDRFAQVLVADDGTGIAPELLPRVFEPFVQGERSLDRPEGGLGIGLTLVHRLVELHGGTVIASSPGQGRGSTFTVRIPLAAGARPSGAGGEPPAAHPHGRKLRVLLVEDNGDAAESMVMLLEAWGHEVETAADGRSALSSAERFHPDVVLLDIGLPHMNGYDVAQRLQGSGAALIAMTGYGQPEDAQRAKAAGFLEHLVKPVAPDRLQRLMADLALRRA